MQEWVVIDQFGNVMGNQVYFDRKTAEEVSKNTPYTQVVPKQDIKMF